LVDPQLIFPGVFVQGEAVKNREAGANNSNHYRLYGCLWMFMVIILVIIYNLILSSRYYIVESHGKPTG
jgi:hypothetical protein